MSDNDVKDIFWQSYNVFWNKWKAILLTKDSEEWDQVVKDAEAIMLKHDCALCKQVVLALLGELEDRCRERGGK